MLRSLREVAHSSHVYPTLRPTYGGWLNSQNSVKRHPATADVSTDTVAGRRSMILVVPNRCSGLKSITTPRGMWPVRGTLMDVTLAGLTGE